MFRSMHKVFAGAALTFTLLGGAAQVQANDNYRHEPAKCRETTRCEPPVRCRETYRCEPPVQVRVCHYRWVECEEIQRVPYTHCVTKHDKCGHCYEATETCYRTVKVIVRKRVAYYD